MNLVAIETSTEISAVAVVIEDKLKAALKINMGKKHAELVIPEIDFLLSATGVCLDDMDAVGVDIGPGLFTGLRVGIATAKLLADVKDLELYGIRSLDAIADGARAAGHKYIATVLKARAREVFFGFYKATDEELLLLEGPLVLNQDDLIKKLDQLGDNLSEPISVFGNATELIKNELNYFAAKVICFDVLSVPPVSSIASLVVKQELAVRFDPVELEPLYLRPPDAKINWKERSIKDEN